MPTNRPSLSSFPCTCAQSCSDTAGGWRRSNAWRSAESYAHWFSLHVCLFGETQFVPSCPVLLLLRVQKKEKDAKEQEQKVAAEKDRRRARAYEEWWVCGETRRMPFWIVPSHVLVFR